MPLWVMTGVSIRSSWCRVTRISSFPPPRPTIRTCESDTWFLAGELTGESDRKFAFLTIFNKNRPGQAIVADFYTLALFDLDNGTYGTYTDYDMPGTNKEGAIAPQTVVVRRASGHVLRLPRGYLPSGGPAATSRANLVPYTYDVSFCGTDHHGDTMKLDLHVTPSRAPVPLGAAAYNGVIECFGQANTYSYFQTRHDHDRNAVVGFGAETVTGSAGHVDRQWFPMVANDGGPTGDIRSRAHEWRTINLDNGVDISIWRQFDRTNRNALQPFSGATTSSPDADPEYADDIEVDRHQLRALARVDPHAGAAARGGSVHARSSSLDVTQARPGPDGGAVGARAGARLPLEYMEGPYRYHGTLSRRAGQRIRVLRTVNGAVSGLGTGRRAGGRRAGGARRGGAAHRRTQRLTAFVHVS